jgi:hypothetical protein
LSSRARKFAEGISMSTRRMRGFFPVARVLFKNDRRLIPEMKLKKQIEEEEGVSDQIAAKEAVGVRGEVEAWASVEYVPTVEDNRENRKEVSFEKIHMEDEIDEKVGEYITGCVNALSSAGMAASLLDADTCPICIALMRKPVPSVLL